MSDEFDQPSTPPVMAPVGSVLLLVLLGEILESGGSATHPGYPLQLQLVLLIKVTLLHTLNYILSGPNIQ